VRVQVEPLVSWPFEETAGGRREYSPFSATYSTTLDDLDRELFALGAQRHGVVALQVVTADHSIRRDGLLRAGARISHPGVALSFGSDLGPMTFFCDRFVARSGGADWEHNLRALVLTLEKMRAIDRYGATNNGQQYTGFLAIEAPRADHVAARLRLAEIGEAVVSSCSDTQLVRAARRKAHPDAHAGRVELWDEVESLTRVLGV
jgi:hypothetical protein